MSLKPAWKYGQVHEGVNRAQLYAESSIFLPPFLYMIVFSFLSNLVVHNLVLSFKTQFHPAIFDRIFLYNIYDQKPSA